jgi:DNA-binding transcriptional MerR regulator
MAARHLRTSQIAKDLGVHVNTIRLYEADGLLPAIPRAPNGYRQYTIMHLEQARLAHLSLRWPYLNDKALLIDLVKSAANVDLGMAMELAYKYLAHVRVVRTFAESAEDEEMQTIADRWLSTLLELEQRAQAMIRQIGHMIEMTHSR